MSKTCKFCGMESDRDQVCSWCGKNLTESAAPAAATAATSSGATPPAAQPRSAAHAMLDSEEDDLEALSGDDEPVEIERLGPPTPARVPGGPVPGAASKAPEPPSAHTGAAAALFEACARKSPPGSASASPSR